MFFQCFGWISHVFNELTNSFLYWHKKDTVPQKKRTIPQLSDDLIIDILSRLPADQVIKCRGVCRKWRSWTLSKYFINLNLSRATTSILVQDTEYLVRGNPKLVLISFDETACTRNTIKRLRLRPGLAIRRNYVRHAHSCDGLLLFGDLIIQGRYYIFNPVTQEEICINGPVVSKPKAKEGILLDGTMIPFAYVVCGFFYHSLTSQFKLLFLHRQGRRCQYFICALGVRTCRKIDSSNLHIWPSGIASPAVMNGALHWIVSFDYETEEDIPSCSNAIIVFRMDAEDFLVFPHPGKECKSRRVHEKMHLLVKDNYLSFFNFDYKAKIIYGWILEDYTNWGWIRKWKLNLDLVDRPPVEIRFGYEAPRIELLKIENGELWLDSWTEGLLVYNLDQNRVTILRIPHILFGNGHHLSFTITKSLVRAS